MGKLRSNQFRCMACNVIDDAKLQSLMSVGIPLHNNKNEPTGDLARTMIRACPRCKKTIENGTHMRYVTVKGFI